MGIENPFIKTFVEKTTENLQRINKKWAYVVIVVLFAISLVVGTFLYFRSKKGAKKG